MDDTQEYGAARVIDLEALAVPAFLVRFSPQNAPIEMHLNAAARVRAELLRLATLRTSQGRGDGANSDMLVAALRDCAASRVGSDVALATPGHNGETGWHASLAPLVDQNGRVTAILGICREAAPHEQGPTSADEHLSLTLQAIHGAEWHYDVERGIYQGSDEIATLIGEAAPRPVTWAEWLERVHPQDLGLFLSQPAPEGIVEFRFHAAGGELRWARCSRVAVTGKDGEVETVLGVMVDITQERVRETAWAELATHDPLTGLLNRLGLRQEIDRLRMELAPTSSLALFAIDLDHFKRTNDDHGHAAGDAVLVEVSRRLAVVMENTVCARLGGDEFVAILPVSDQAEAQRLRERLWRAFRRPLAFRGRWLSVSASVGVACKPGWVEVADLMDVADADLYTRKRAKTRSSMAA